MENIDKIINKIKEDKQNAIILPSGKVNEIELIRKLLMRGEFELLEYLCKPNKYIINNKEEMIIIIDMFSFISWNRQEFLSDESDYKYKKN